MKRVLVVGTSGSGKSTLARQLAARTGLPYYPSDDFYWQPKPNWHPAPTDRVDHLLNEVLEKPAWILDGNFESRWEDAWNQADQIIWLDYSLPRVLWQVTTRNLGWFLSRRPAWSGNRMTLPRALSGIRHSLRSHGRKRRAYPHYITQLRHGNVTRLASPRQTEAWLSRLSPNSKCAHNLASDGHPPPKASPRTPPPTPNRLCPTCGYDFRATAEKRGPLLRRCPECGTAPSRPT